MRSVPLRLDDLKSKILYLGYVGENEHTRFSIDCKTMYDQYPNAAVSLTVRPPKGDPYPAVVERVGDTVVWDITDSDLVDHGYGSIQMSFTSGEIVAKTCICQTKIFEAMIPVGEIPTPLDDFLTRAGAALTAIPETIRETFGRIGADAETLPIGETATAVFDSEHMMLYLGIPLGPKGDKGDTGAQGPKGDKGDTGAQGPKGDKGDTGAQGPKGDKGDTGAQGPKGDKGDTGSQGPKGDTGSHGPKGDTGTDGYSPLASVVKIGHTATLLVSDKNGTTEVEIYDGTDGDPTTLIDDNAGSGGTGKTWSADKIATEITQTQKDIITKGRVKLLQDNEWGADRSAIATGRSYSVSKNVVTKAQGSASTAYRYALIFGGDTIKSPADSNIETLFSALDPTTDFIAIPAYQSVSNRSVILQFIVDLETSTGGDANPEIFRIITADSQGNISEANAVTVPQLNSKANKAKGIIEINLNDYAPSVLTNGKIAIVDYSRNSAWEGTVTVNLYLTPRFGNTVNDVQINGTSIMNNGVANIPLPITQSVSGSTPSITGVADTRYVCGECATLSITAPASGCIDILFESGSTPTVLTVASAKTGVTDIKWMDGFDPDDLDANTIYEINILDGEFGVVAEWT